jgi:hypothetical protein
MFNQRRNSNPELEETGMKCQRVDQNTRVSCL